MEQSFRSQIIDKISQSNQWSYDVYNHSKYGKTVLILYGNNFEICDCALISLIFVPTEYNSYRMHGRIATTQGSNIPSIFPGEEFEMTFEGIRDLLFHYSNYGRYALQRGLDQLQRNSPAIDVAVGPESM